MALSRRFIEKGRENRQPQYIIGPPIAGDRGALLHPSKFRFEEIEINFTLKKLPT
jgi:hypothetical protein